MCLITLMDLLKMILFFIEFYPVVLKIISVIGFCIGRCLAKFGQLRDLGADFVKIMYYNLSQKFSACTKHFAATRAGVTQRFPSLSGDGERCVTPVRVAANVTTYFLACSKK